MSWKDLYSEVKKRKMETLNKKDVVKAVEKYGKIDEIVYGLFDAYFAFVMAMCTCGRHRQGRVLKGIIALNAAIGSRSC